MNRTTKPETIEKCIYWQMHVLRHSRDPKQRERCAAAIEKLTKELNQLLEVTA
jgi:hypothetical protein